MRSDALKYGALTFVIGMVAATSVAGAETHPASPKGFKTGIEWGIDAAFYSNHYYNFITESGYAIRGRHNSSMFIPNGTLSLSAVYDFGNGGRLSLLAGYCGLADKYRVIPVTLRGAWFSPVTRYAGWTAFTEAGMTVRDDFKTRPDPVISAGFGWRVSVSADADLEFMVRYRCALRQPPLKDPEYNTTVDQQNIRHNVQILHTLGFVMGLCF